MQKDALPSVELMQRAARGVWNQIQQRWPDLRNMTVFAGAGNNGGDAFALAIMARQAGIQVQLITMGDLERQSSESRYYREQWQHVGEIQRWQGQIADCDLIVDGLLGIGLKQSLDQDWQVLIDQINRHSGWKVSIDIPSGLNADTGNAMPCAVRADMTMSFIGRKIGCFLADGMDFCGDLVFDDLGVSSAIYQQVEPCAQILDDNRIHFPDTRRKNSHKYQYGHVLVVGGDRSMSGAARLAGMAALRCGAGLVSLCVHPDNVAMAAARHEELMVSGWEQMNELLQKASVVVIGPGLGHSTQAQNLLMKLGPCNKPVVVDADALHSEFLSSLTSKSVVITPHPGEAARLLHCTTSDIQQDRLSAIEQLIERWHAVSVLKGAGTLIGAHDQTLSLCRQGHAGMASAGMGDVLSGMIAGYLAQGLAAVQAAQTAVLVHALCADLYAQTQDANSLIASDVIDLIGSVVRRCRQTQGVEP